MHHQDTIAAIATPQGEGGVAIVRISGPEALQIGERITAKKLQPRLATFADFTNLKSELIDKGIAIYFKSPNSFTGEDVVELHGHGGLVAPQLLLKAVLELGACLASPGEFTKRAFMAGKIDLTQAEAVADLIHAKSERAAQFAVHSLQGEFSKLINSLVAALIRLRVNVEAGIDFPEEDLEELLKQHLISELCLLQTKVEEILGQSRNSLQLQESAKVIILGKPNSGKSSLLNALTGMESAIVTSIAGTTRDMLKEQINLDGICLQLIDTAGLRDTSELIEQEGIRRALAQAEFADHILWICDLSSKEQEIPNFKIPLTKIYNKIDLMNLAPKVEGDEIWLSAHTKQGLSLLIEHLKAKLQPKAEEGVFLARTRHIEALDKALLEIEAAQKQLQKSNCLWELIAENLCLAQEKLSSITGQFSNEDLLGEIFSNFCIGK